MNEKLFDIIKYAYNNSDFYKKKLSADYTDHAEH